MGVLLSQLSHHGFLTEVSVELGHFVLIHLVELWVDLLLRVDDVLLQEILGERLHPLVTHKGGGTLRVLPIPGGGGGVMADVTAHHKPCQILILTEGRKVASLTLYTHTQD